MFQKICCLGVVEDFHKLKKYNIQEIQNASKNKDSREQCADQTENHQLSKEEHVSDKNFINDELSSEGTIQNTNPETLDDKTGVKENGQSNKEKSDVDDTSVVEQNLSTEITTSSAETECTKENWEILWGRLRCWPECELTLIVKKLLNENNLVVVNSALGMRCMAQRVQKRCFSKLHSLS